MPVDIRLSYDDYCLLPNDGKRYEIIDGELFVTPSPRTAHQKVVTNLCYYLADFIKKEELGEVYVAPFDVVFSRLTSWNPMFCTFRRRAPPFSQRTMCKARQTWSWRSFLNRRPILIGRQS